MTGSVTFTSPAPGFSPSWCPFCDRATVTSYRCSNYDCGKDLTDVHLIPVKTNGGEAVGE